MTDGWQGQRVRDSNQGKGMLSASFTSAVCAARLALTQLIVPTVPVARTARDMKTLQQKCHSNAFLQAVMHPCPQYLARHGQNLLSACIRQPV